MDEPVARHARRLQIRYRADGSLPSLPQATQRHGPFRHPCATLRRAGRRLLRRIAASAAVLSLYDRTLPPGLLLGALVSAGFAGLFHLGGGRSLRDLVAYLVASAAGFALGQAMGALLNFPLPRIGQVHIVEASVFAWAAMIGLHELRAAVIGDSVDRA